MQIKIWGAFNKHRDIASNALSAIEIAIEAATIAKAAFDGISNYFNERELKKENKLKLEQQKKELEQVKIKFKNIAKEKIDTVKEIHDFLLKSSSTLFITLKDSCSEIMPISESVRRRSHREGINKTYNNYFTILKLKTRVEFVISVFLNFINGSDDISGFKKVNDHDIRKSIYDEIYDFSDVDKLINDATSIVYYNNGICEGVLYCFSNKEIIKGNRKWRDALNKFKIIYSKEAFKTHSFFKQTNADKKRTQYNNVYLKDIPNIDSIYKQNVKRKKERIFISLGIATAVVLASLLIIFYSPEMTWLADKTWHIIAIPIILVWHIIFWITMLIWHIISFFLHIILWFVHAIEWLAIGFWNITKWIFSGLGGPLSIWKIIHIILAGIYSIFALIFIGAIVIVSVIING